MDIATRMSENKDLDKSMEGEDPDSYIRTIASTWGHTDLVGEWLPHHRDNPSKITDNVLIPAAMYGQLEVLKLGLEFGKSRHQAEILLSYRHTHLLIMAALLVKLH